MFEPSCTVLISFTDNSFPLCSLDEGTQYLPDQNFKMTLEALFGEQGVKAKIFCSLMDESNMLDSDFLERMNTLLANAEVPDLLNTLTAYVGFSLHKWFIRQVAEWYSQ